MTAPELFTPQPPVVFTITMYPMTDGRTRVETQCDPPIQSVLPLVVAMLQICSNFVQQELSGHPELARLQATLVRPKGEDDDG